MYSPGLSKVGPVGHDLLGELDLLLVVAEAQVERLPEHEGDLVRVHGPGPLGPGGGGGDLREVVHVDVTPHLGVLVAEVQDGAGELPVARHPVHGHPVGDRVLGVQPVAVLELDSFPLQLVRQGEGFRDRMEELGSVDEDVLGGPAEGGGEEVEDEIIPLVLV